VARKRHQIGLDFPDIKRNAPGCLRGIGVKRCTRFLHNGAERRQVLNDADFVIHRHDGHQQGVCITGGAQHFGIQQPIGADRQDDGFKPFLRQVPHGFEDAFMFGRERDDAPARIALARRKARGALDGEVVCLSRAGGEDDLGG
jgi:hypothetical protein